GSGIRGFANGARDVAQFGECSGIVADGFGNIFLTDYDNLRVRKISASGEVTTVAGNGAREMIDGRPEDAAFFSPVGIVIDKGGNLFVADWNRIRKISPAGVVSTFVGSNLFGTTDGDASVATFRLIADMVIDEQENIYVEDDDRIRKITPAGEVSTIAGSTKGYLDGNGRSAKFNGAVGLGIDQQGNLYVADANNNRIREVSFK
ncbi:MAG: hypothetical protein ACJ749_19800, partial [Flavisolibacter sp.]